MASSRISLKADLPLSVVALGQVNRCDYYTLLRPTINISSTGIVQLSVVDTDTNVSILLADWH
jgi:hypothetical protein